MTSRSCLPDEERDFPIQEKQPNFGVLIFKSFAYLIFMVMVDLGEDYFLVRFCV